MTPARHPPETGPIPLPTRTASALALAAFLSGAAALSFEVLWFHQAGLAFGNSVWATSLVLAAFMGGLALGNGAAAAAGDRVRRPIRLYGGLELAIGASGVALVLGLPALGPLLAPLLRPLLETPVALNAARLALAFLALLIPSTAMGMTLPILVGALGREGRSFGGTLGRLYGWNTLGAVAGVLLAEGILIGALGIRGTAAAAAGLNLAAAGIAFALARATGPGERARASGGGAPPASGDPSAGGPARVWLASAFVCGFVLLAMEVVWFRILLLFVMGESLSFAVMLAIVLAGIGLGGFAAGAWANRRRVAGAAPALLFLAGALCLVSYVAVHRFAPSPGTPLVTDPLGVFRIALPVVVPLSLLSGALFTLLGTGLRERVPSDTGTTGWLTTANTLGAMLGAVAGGFVLLPTLGMERSLQALAVAYAVTGGALAFAAVGSRRWATAGAAVFLAALVTFPSGTSGRLLLAPVARFGSSLDTRVVAVREGVSQTVVLTEQSWGTRHLSYALLTDGYSMSGTNDVSKRYMGLYVYWPLAVHPGIRDALLISYGVGNTAKALTDAEEIRRIDVVDTSRDVLDLSTLVFEEGAVPLADPRVTVHVEDGRYHLLTTERRYDLITGEPPPPMIKGVVSLYTREYFELVHDRLNEGGIATYWLPIHDLSPHASLAILRAFCDAFPDCSLWHGAGHNLMMVGTRGLEGPAPLDRFVRLWEDPATARELGFLGLEAPERLGALFIGDAEYLAGLTREVAPLTDDRPRLVLAPYDAAEAARLYEAWLGSQGAEERWRSSAWVASIWPAELVAASLPAFEDQRAVVLIERGGIPLPTAYAAAHRLLLGTSSTYPLGSLFGLNSSAFRTAAAVRGDPRDTGDEYLLGLEALGRRDFAAAADRFARAEPDLRWGALAFGFRTYALCLAGRSDEVRALSERIEREIASYPERSWFWGFLRDTAGCDWTPG